MFDFRNGKPLMDRLIPDGLSHAATSFVESLKINSITEKTLRNRHVVIKRRNVYGERAAGLINFYFGAADIPIRYLSDVREWRQWEARCFHMLNGDRFRATVTDSRTVTLDKLPGNNLWDHMNRGTLTPRMLKAAGSEYRRAHHLKSEEFGSGWSHGDASMTNVIYNEKTERARLIDFEIRHEKSLPATARHADDLLVFLLDMVGRVPNRQWLPFAIGFLRAYGDGAVMRELKKRLVIPSGLAAIWWNVRTNFTDSAKVNRRFQALRRAIGKLELHRSRTTARPRNKRRPSTTCQRMRPGMPTTKSRKRASRDMAKAVSPGMPRRLPTTR
jgi:tRNA A-37 threonylcarbamoyl transferase component Bud32